MSTPGKCSVGIGIADGEQLIADSRSHFYYQSLAMPYDYQRFFKKLKFINRKFKTDFVL